MTTTGRRLPDGTEPYRLKPGDYVRVAADGWYGMPPGTDLLATLRLHTVVEHEDGTITVTPSILVRNNTTEWHGYLERGVWRSA